VIPTQAQQPRTPDATVAHTGVLSHLRARALRKMSHWIANHAYRLARLRWHLSTGVYIEVANQIEWQIYTDIFADGDYDRPLLELFERDASRPLTVGDLGANVGFFALRLAHLAGVHAAARPIHIEAFEASAGLCARAKQRWSECRLEDNNLQFNVTHGLIGRKSGAAEFFEQHDHGRNSLFRKSRRRELVSYVDLSAHFANVECIDLVKCDIEGSEQMFFESYPDLLAKTHAVVVELHHGLCDTERCTSLLKDAGFAGHRVIEKGPFDSLEYFWKHGAAIN